MSVTVFLELSFIPEKAEEAIAYLKEITPDTAAFDGCLALVPYSNQDDSANLVIVEEWETKEHHQKYMAWRQETGFIEKVGPMLAAPPSTRYFNKG